MVNEENVNETWFQKAMNEAEKQKEEMEGKEDTPLLKLPDNSQENVTILGEPDLTETKDNRLIAVFPVEYGEDCEKRAWIVNRKYGDKAPFMQITRIVEKRGSIPESGLPVKVIITGEGQNRQYTILDLKEL